MSECVDHLDFANSSCPNCGLKVDAYGNTEDDWPPKYCAFPDCGCDGERLCMAGEASERALRGNAEGMWIQKPSAKQRRARMELLGMVVDDKRAAKAPGGET